MNALTRFTSASLALAVLLSAGCGGGGGYSTPPVVTPPPTGGITRTGIGYAEGPITGFGSVIVNGVEYDTSAATFTKDGAAATQDDFSVGQVVQVKGSIDNNNSNASANSVEFNDAVEGPVSSVDAVANTIVVLGQTVQISATTSIDNSCPDSLDGLLAIPAVEISGLPNASGVIEASRIDCRDGTWDGVMEVNGIVSAHSSGAMTFMINALEVRYGSATVDNFPTAGIINDGDPVEAKGVSLAGAALTATRVEYQGARFADNAGDHMEIEGFITRFVSAADFDVNGIAVKTIASTTYVGGTAANLGLNLKVEVEGEFDSAGVLNATKVEIKTSTAIRVTGRIDSVSGNTLVVLGITVNTDAIKTRFEDKVSGGGRIDPLHVTDLNVDDYVAIRGQELPAGEITALIVERDDANDSRIELRGFVTVKSEPNLTVLGVTMVTDGLTQYRDSRGATETSMTAVDFWLAVSEGSLVDARGAETGPDRLTATEVALEN